MLPFSQCCAYHTHNAIILHQWHIDIVSYTIAMVGEYVTSYCLYSAHKLCQITWHSGLLAQLEQHIIVGICCLSQYAKLTRSGVQILVYAIIWVGCCNHCGPQGPWLT